MHLLLLSVTCSVLVSVLLKSAARLRIDVAQAVTWNYLAAATLCAWLLRPPLSSLQAPGAPWPELLALAVALPSIFLVLARSVALAGIVRSDAAQRLSLLLSLAAAFVLFGEHPGGWKLAGLGVGLLAMAGILARPAQALDAPGWQHAWTMRWMSSSEPLPNSRPASGGTPKAAATSALRAERSACG